MNIFLISLGIILQVPVFVSMTLLTFLLSQSFASNFGPIIFTLTLLCSSLFSIYKLFTGRKKTLKENTVMFFTVYGIYALELIALYIALSNFSFT